MQESEISLESFDLKSFLQEKGFTVRHSSGEYQIVALWRGGQNYNVSINPRTGKWFDFVDSRGGNIKQLLQIIGGEIDYNSLPVSYGEVLDIPQKFDKELLKSLIKNHNYWKNRGISETVCQKFNGGITDLDIMPKLKNRYCLPIFDRKDDLVGFTARYIGDSKSPEIPKYKNIGKKSEWVWPLNNNIKDKKSVILVESPGCILALYECGIENCLCIFGINIFKSIINYLVSLDVEKIYIATNNDNKHSVGQNAAEEIREKLSLFFDKSSIEILLPLKKDVNDMLLELGSQSIIDLYGEKSI